MKRQLDGKVPLFRIPFLTHIDATECGSSGEDLAISVAGREPLLA
jgi:hypothetical protein